MTLDHEHHRTHWRSSGLSRAAYCRQHGITYHTTRLWGKAAAIPDGEHGGSAFIEVLPRRADPIGHESALVAAVCLPGGVVLRVQVGTDPGWIGRVAEAVHPC